FMFSRLCPLITRVALKLAMVYIGPPSSSPNSPSRSSWPCTAMLPPMKHMIAMARRMRLDLAMCPIPLHALIVHRHGDLDLLGDVVAHHAGDLDAVVLGPHHESAHQLQRTIRVHRDPTWHGHCPAHTMDHQIARGGHLVGARLRDHSMGQTGHPPLEGGLRVDVAFHIALVEVFLHQGL